MQNLRRVGENYDPILSRLWTKVHEIFRRCRKRCTVQPPRFATRPFTAKRDVIHKTGSSLNNLSQHRQSRIETRPQRICAPNFVKIGEAVPEIYSRTDRQTDRQTDRRVDGNTPHPYRAGVKIATPRMNYRTERRTKGKV